MGQDIKAYDQFWALYNNNLEFQMLVSKYLQSGKIRFFGEQEWKK